SSPPHKSPAPPATCRAAGYVPGQGDGHRRGFVAGKQRRKTPSSPPPVLNKEQWRRSLSAARHDAACATPHVPAVAAMGLRPRRARDRLAPRGGARRPRVQALRNERARTARAAPRRGEGKPPPRSQDPSPEQQTAARG